MIQTSTFRHAKSMARYPLGYGGEVAYQYWSDTRRQWEDSNDPGKMFDLIGSQNAPSFRHADLQKTIGKLSTEELALKQAFESFYARIPSTITSTPVRLNTEIDALETILDLRQMKPLLASAKRILDIGPGSGRHMVGLTLSGQLNTRNYIGLEGIGLPYVLQSALGGCLAGDGHITRYRDYLDYQFARLPFGAEEWLAPNTIAHLPSWEAEHIPDKSVDLMICSYVLDEFSPDDYLRLVAMIDRVLAPGGTLYCRGSQERALRTNFNHYGYGHHHGQDITQSLTAIGLVASHCDLLVDTVTRVFVRPAGAAVAPTVPFGEHDSDATLVPALNDAFVASLADELSSSGARVVVWGEPGHRRHQEILEAFKGRINIVGFTSRTTIAETPLANGFTDFPPSKLNVLKPDAVLFLSYRFQSYYRELKETMPPETFTRMRHFLTPLAVAFR
jgi:hypothetical protein